MISVFVSFTETKSHLILIGPVSLLTVIGSPPSLNNFHPDAGSWSTCNPSKRCLPAVYADQSWIIPFCKCADQIWVKGVWGCVSRVCFYLSTHKSLYYFVPNISPQKFSIYYKQKKTLKYAIILYQISIL